MNGFQCTYVLNKPTGCSTASIEALESRLLLAASATLSNGVLTVRGTPSADKIWIHHPPGLAGGPIIVDIGPANNPTSYQFDAWRVRVIRAYGGAGDDAL